MAMVSQAALFYPIPSSSPSHSQRDHINSPAQVRDVYSEVRSFAVGGLTANFAVCSKSILMAKICGKMDTKCMCTEHIGRWGHLTIRAFVLFCRNLR